MGKYRTVTDTGKGPICAILPAVMSDTNCIVIYNDVISPRYRYFRSGVFIDLGSGLSASRAIAVHGYYILSIYDLVLANSYRQRRASQYTRRQQTRIALGHLYVKVGQAIHFFRSFVRKPFRLSFPVSMDFIEDVWRFLPLIWELS